MKVRRVTGEARVSWSVEVPVGEGYGPVAAEDPAVEAVLVALGKEGATYLWGEDREPATFHVDVWEEDVDVEDDEEVEK